MRSECFVNIEKKMQFTYIDTYLFSRVYYYVTDVYNIVIISYTNRNCDIIFTDLLKIRRLNSHKSQQPHNPIPPKYHGQRI